MFRGYFSVDSLVVVGCWFGWVDGNRGRLGLVVGLHVPVAVWRVR